MPSYRRARVPGATYFFTVVTMDRRPILTGFNSRAMLREAITEVQANYPFTIEAWVLLPDHLHCVWTLPENDYDFSKRWGMIKAGFTKRVRNHFHNQELWSKSRRRHGESTIWQRRFWEHQIRNDRDYRQHVEYIHYNPIKHGLVNGLNDYPYSTFHRYVMQGLYPKDWGDEIEQPLGDFGE